MSDTPDFRAIYDEHCKGLFRSARGLGVPKEHVDDVLQEVFLVVHRRLNEFEGRSKLRTWLYGILWNCVSDYRKKRRREGPTEDPPEMPDSGRRPDEALFLQQASQAAVSLLDYLEDEQRTVFVLTEVEELSAPEISEILGVPLNTVYSRLRLARRKINDLTMMLRAKQEKNQERVSYG